MVCKQVNELAEVRLKVDHDMVHTMHKLTDTMSCASMGGSAGSGTSGWAVGISVGVDWPGECERGASKGRGRSGLWRRERVGRADDGRGWGDEGGGSDGWSGGGVDRGRGGDGDDDDAPDVKYIV